MYYFAYGSNLSTDQLRERIGAVRAIGAGMLRGHELVFSGYSSTRGGATASLRPSRGGAVPGQVFRVSSEQIEQLDRYEGHPTHYKRFDVTVDMDDDTSLACVTYRRPTSAELGAPPMDYFVTILRGYREHRLGEDPLLDALLRSVR